MSIVWGLGLAGSVAYVVSTRNRIVQTVSEHNVHDPTPDEQLSRDMPTSNDILRQKKDTSDTVYGDFSEQARSSKQDGSLATSKVLREQQRARGAVTTFEKAASAPGQDADPPIEGLYMDVACGPTI
jgi:hypothetical protein